MWLPGCFSQETNLRKSKFLWEPTEIFFFKADTLSFRTVGPRYNSLTSLYCRKKANHIKSLYGEVSFGVIIWWTVTHCYRWPAARGKWDAVSGQEKQREPRHRKTILADLWAELINQPWMNEIRPLQPSAGVLSEVGRKYTHAHTHSEISLRKAACYLQPFKHVLFFIAIVFDTTFCVKEPLILASPLFFHSLVSFTLSRSSFIPVPFSFSSLCLFFSHPFHFFPARWSGLHRNVILSFYRGQSVCQKGWFYLWWHRGNNCGRQRQRKRTISVICFS